MLFGVAILNLVCGCILGNRVSCTCFGVVVTLSDFVFRIFVLCREIYHFWATVTLTSDLIFIIIVSGAYLLYYLSWESQIWLC